MRAESLDSIVEGSTFARRLGAVVEVAQAVAALHAVRLVHGHLLPQNVLMRRERTGVLTPVVTDAGVRLRHDPAFHDGPDVAPRRRRHAQARAHPATLAGGLDRDVLGGGRHVDQQDADQHQQGTTIHHRCTSPAGR